MSTQALRTQEKIKIAAIRLFLEKGFERTSIREIARKAKINIALLNYYFRSKENLFDSIFSWLLGSYTPALTKILDSELPLEDKIRKYVDTYIDILIENPRLTYFVLSVLHRNPEKIIKMKVFKSLYNTEIFAKQINEEARKGLIRETNPGHFFINMLSLITFPFTIKYALMREDRLDEKGFIKYMIDRKKIISEMLLMSIKN